MLTESTLYLTSETKGITRYQTATFPVYKIEL